MTLAVATVSLLLVSASMAQAQPVTDDETTYVNTMYALMQVAVNHQAPPHPGTLTSQEYQQIAADLQAVKDYWDNVAVPDHYQSMDADFGRYLKNAIAGENAFADVTAQVEAAAERGYWVNEAQRTAAQAKSSRPTGKWRCRTMGFRRLTPTSVSSWA